MQVCMKTCVQFDTQKEALVIIRKVIDWNYSIMFKFDNLIVPHSQIRTVSPYKHEQILINEQFPIKIEFERLAAFKIN